MKDYRLSEIKEICKSTTENGGCLKCLLYPEVCIDMIGKTVPNNWGVDPRDMIELPCKEHFIYTHYNGHITENWRVYYRAEFNLIETAFFPTEAEADVFMEEKKQEAKDKDERELAELYDMTDTFNKLAGKKRAGGKLTDAEVDKMLAAYERMCEIEKKRAMRL